MARSGASLFGKQGNHVFDPLTLQVGDIVIQLGCQGPEPGRI